MEEFMNIIKYLKQLKCKLLGHKSPVDVFIMLEKFQDYDASIYDKIYSHTTCNYCDLKYLKDAY